MAGSPSAAVRIYPLRKCLSAATSLIGLSGVRALCRRLHISRSAHGPPPALIAQDMFRWALILAFLSVEQVLKLVGALVNLR